MKNKMEFSLAFNPMEYDQKVNFKKIIDYIKNTKEFKVKSQDKHRIDFFSEDKKEKLRIHSDGRLHLSFTDLEKNIDKELPLAIHSGYELVKDLKQVDLIYRREISAIFYGPNTQKIYNEKKDSIKKEMAKILGDTDIDEICLDEDLISISYRPSRILK
jgi:hypothetical protein